MPIYDYACANCGHMVEVVHGVHDPGPTACPRCGGLLRKQLSSPAIHFRGSGWAKKDARDAAAKKPAEPGKAAEDGKRAAGAGEGKAATPEKGAAASASTAKE